MRVQNIVSELDGEKIDIIKYDKDPERYISNALSPSRVVAVNTNETDKVARVIVPDYQLSLAIGKEGQNARLAAKLTGWKVDIRSESQMSDYYNEIDAEIDDEVLEQDWTEEMTGETEIDEQDS